MIQETVPFIKQIKHCCPCTVVPNVNGYAKFQEVKILIRSLLFICFLLIYRTLCQGKRYRDLKCKHLGWKYQESSWWTNCTILAKNVYGRGWTKGTLVQYAKLVIGNEDNWLCCVVLQRVQSGRNVMVTSEANKITCQMSLWKHLTECVTNSRPSTSGAHILPSLIRVLSWASSSSMRTNLIRNYTKNLIFKWWSTKYCV